MEARNQKRDDRRKRSLLVLLLLVCSLAVSGTIAWLTHSSQLDNCFTVGKINEVDPGGEGPGPIDPENPDKPVEPDEIDKNDEKLNGNLYEPSWDSKNAKLQPAVKISKDPYVGVGEGSEPCKVYVNVTNNMNNNDHVYFKLEDGWKAVEGKEVKNIKTKDGEEAKGKFYTSGLFEYTKGLDGTKLEKKEEAKKNIWTEKPVFKQVIVSKDANEDDFKINEDKNFKDESRKDAKSYETPVIRVQSFLHQSEGTKNAELNPTEIENTVKEHFGYNVEK